MRAIPNQALTAAYSPRSAGPSSRAMTRPAVAAEAVMATFSIAVIAIARRLPVPPRRLNRYRAAVTEAPLPRPRLSHMLHSALVRPVVMWRDATLWSGTSRLTAHQWRRRPATESHLLLP